jgi:hypothetical protein
VRINLQDHGRFWLADPQDRDAAAWLTDTAPADPMWFGPCLVIEWRAVNEFASAAKAAGVELVRVYYEARRRLSAPPSRH